MQVTTISNETDGTRTQIILDNGELGIMLSVFHRLVWGDMSQAGVIAMITAEDKKVDELLNDLSTAGPEGHMYTVLFKALRATNGERLAHLRNLITKL